MTAPTVLNAEQLAALWGPIPLDRVRTDPLPGLATEADVVRIHEREDRLCELVDGVLVEKAVGFPEGLVEARLIERLGVFVRERRLGVVSSATGMFRLAPGLVRLPDVSFVAAHRLSPGVLPSAPMFEGAPDLAIEILSPSNTRREMERKIADLFAAGARLVWVVDPRERSARVCRSSTDARALEIDDALDGEDVLPGFRLPLADLFAPFP